MTKIQSQKPEAEKEEEGVQESIAPMESTGEIYILQGIKNFKCGKWHFVDEMLVLTDKEEIKEFDAFLRAGVMEDQYVRRIRKVQGDSDSLKTMKEKLVAAAVNGVETSQNRPAQNLRQV